MARDGQVGATSHGSKLAAKIGEGTAVLEQGSSDGGIGVAGCVLVAAMVDIRGVASGSWLLKWLGRPA